MEKRQFLHGTERKNMPVLILIDLSSKERRKEGDARYLHDCTGGSSKEGLSLQIVGGESPRSVRSVAR